jgi:hypothetical protein
MVDLGPRPWKRRPISSPLGTVGARAELFAFGDLAHVRVDRRAVPGHMAVRGRGEGRIGFGHGEGVAGARGMGMISAAIGRAGCCGVAPARLASGLLVAFGGRRWGRVWFSFGTVALLSAGSGGFIKCHGGGGHPQRFRIGLVGRYRGDRSVAVDGSIVGDNGDSWWWALMLRDQRNMLVVVGDKDRCWCVVRHPQFCGSGG